MVQRVPVYAAHKDVFVSVIVVVANGDSGVIPSSGEAGFSVTSVNVPSPLLRKSRFQYLLEVFFRVEISAPLVKKRSRLPSLS